MLRTFSAFGAAGLIAFASAAAAQSRPATTTDDKWDAKEMTITGCVEKTKSGGYFLRAADESRPGRTTGTTGSTSTTTTTDDKDKKGAYGRHITWNLGQSDRIERYVGQEVQVIGHPEKGTSGDELKGTTGEKEIKARDFDVKSVKMISSSCR